MERVEVLLLGTGDAFGSGGRFQTCFSLRVPQTHVLIDCGPSVLITLRRHGLQPASVDTILLTHLHGDHFGGIPFFLLDAALVSGRDRPLTIAGPSGLEARIRSAMEVLFPGSSQLLERISTRFVELDPGSDQSLGATSVVAYEVIHESGAPAFALRVTLGGKIIAYSGDTEWTDVLLDVARDADLFICEATFYEKSVKYHLDYQTLRARRSSLACRRLVITHMSEDVLRHKEDIDIELAEDGKRFSL